MLWSVTLGSYHLHTVLQTYFWPEPLGASNRTSDWYVQSSVESDSSPKTCCFQSTHLKSPPKNSTLTPCWWVISIIYCLILLIERMTCLSWYLWATLVEYKENLPLRCPGSARPGPAQPAAGCDDTAATAPRYRGEGIKASVNVVLRVTPPSMPLQWAFNTATSLSSSRSLLRFLSGDKLQPESYMWSFYSNPVASVNSSVNFPTGCLTKREKQKNKKNKEWASGWLCGGELCFLNLCFICLMTVAAEL